MLATISRQKEAWLINSGDNLYKFGRQRALFRLSDEIQRSHIVTITPRLIENFFNRAIQQLAKLSVFTKKIHAACDCTLYKATSKFKGCGSVTREVKVKARGYRKSGELKKVPVTLYGWKVWAIYEIKMVFEAKE